MLGRRVLQYNDDVEIGICIPEREADYFYRDGEGDEVIFVHEGSGSSRRSSARSSTASTTTS